MDLPSAAFDHPSAMEPVFPEASGPLEELGFELSQATAALGTQVHPITRCALREVVRSMNSYYSNLIEGHATHPLDIERALEEKLHADSAKRVLQLESRAHIEVQRSIEARLAGDPELTICSADFIQWIHREFFQRLPKDLHVVETRSGRTEKVLPGELRSGEVYVCRHIPPLAKSLPRFFERFAEAYEPAKLKPMQRIIAAAAAHHRLAWIHPFLDGNGRVARLFTHAYLIKTKLNGHGLWMVSRGFSRQRDDYMTALARADAGRANDFDGRGNLSERGLVDFCAFFLKTAIDQVQFMAGLFDFDSMHDRIQRFAKLWCHESGRDSLRSLAARLSHLLSDLFVRGELSRGEATSVLGIPERTAREVLKVLLAEKLLASKGPHKPLRLCFPAHLIGFYFPRLYPHNVEMDLVRSTSIMEDQSPTSGI